MQNMTIHFVSYSFTVRVYWSNFMTHNFWIISNTFYMFTILTKKCVRISTDLFCMYDKCYTHFGIFYYCIFDLNCNLVMLVLNLYLQLHEIFFIIVLVSFIFVWYNYYTISLSCHEQVCFSGLRFERFFSHHRGRSISRNVAHLNVLVQDMINLLYYEYWTDKQKYFYVYNYNIKYFNIYIFCFIRSTYFWTKFKLVRI